jgi:hypothetical protein
MKKIQLLFIVIVSLAMAATTMAQTTAVSTRRIKFIGTTHLRSGAAARKSRGSLSGGFFRKDIEVDEGFDIPGANGNNSPARVRAAHVPTAAGNPIVAGNFSGFIGLTEFEQAYLAFAGPNGVNGELEPPDQGLAVGNGYVVEAINDAITVYDTSGNNLLGPGNSVALNFFFEQGPEATIDPKTGVVGPPFGAFISDPRVLYDASTGHFFVSVVEIDVDPNSGAFLTTSHFMFAVSLDANPLDGFNVFSLDTSTDGDARFGGCPNGCFGDQPLVGFDANGYYASSNAFSLDTQTFRGAQIYAISKAALESTPPSGTPIVVTAVHFGNLNQAEGPGHSIQPAFVPPGGSFNNANGGTEYFVSALDFTHTLDNRLTVWALTNTSSLDSTPNLNLTNAIIDTETYGQPPSTDQKPGPTPLLDLIAQALKIKNHESLIADNDDRLQQVTYANGMLWTSVPTVIQTQQGPARAGGAWFILSPWTTGTQTGASVVNQGYVAINSPMQDGVLFPAVGVNAAGKGVVAFSIAGKDLYPSSGYATLDAANGIGPIVISFNGVAPDDGFSPYFGVSSAPGRVGRWGDYSFAASDENGNIWMGAEVIPTGQAPFIPFANWGTFITAVKP